MEEREFICVYLAFDMCNEIILATKIREELVKTTGNERQSPEIDRQSDRQHFL